MMSKGWKKSRVAPSSTRSDPPHMHRSDFDSSWLRATPRFVSLRHAALCPPTLVEHVSARQQLQV
jgi:hypothetical protein